MSKVSIIIPTYNRACFLGEAIESVVNQTYQDYEIILIDNSSTDNTCEIANSFSSRFPDKIKYFLTKRMSAGEARNYGVQKASGELIAFLDSDDKWLPDKLFLQVKLMEEDRDISLVYTSYNVFNQNGIKSFDWLKNFYSNLPQGYVLNELIMRCFILTSTVIMKREIFEAYDGFDSSLSIGEDYNLWLRIVERNKIGCVPKVLTYYRNHETNEMLLDLKSSAPTEILIVEQFIKKIPKESIVISGSSWRQRLARPYFELGYTSFYKGLRSQARKFFIGAIVKDPFCYRAYKFLFLSLCPAAVLKAIINYRQRKDALKEAER